MPRADNARRRPLRAVGLSVLILGACGEPAGPAPPLLDTGALRAKVSFCLGLDAASAFSFFWPRHLGGVTEDFTARDCVTRATDCPSVLACAGYEAAGCTSVERCEGSTMVSCRTLGAGITAALRTDCGSDPWGNDTCSVAEDPKYGMGAFCHGPSCSAPHCDGTVAVSCRGGFEVRYDCRSEGRSCVEVAGQALCAFEDPCPADSCQGDLIELCLGGYVGLRESCSQLIPGTTCLDPHGLAECRAEVPAPECVGNTEFASWCVEGAVAVSCFGGVRAEVDCGAWAGGVCQPGFRGDRPIATCTTGTGAM